MTWYAAHLILYTKFDDGIQNSYPVWENVVMIEAASSDEAYDRADRKGAAEAASSVSSGYTYDGRPATFVFAGVRKLNECLEYFDPVHLTLGGSEEDGTEVTYSSFIVDTEKSLQKLVENEDVALIYEGRNDQT
jgi:hypothetical protein